MLISLLILPGSGQRDVTLPVGSTIRSLVTAQNLQGRQIVVNGETVPEASFGRALVSGDEVAALASVKGA